MGYNSMNQLHKKTTEQERKELGDFAASVIVRRGLENSQVVTDDIFVCELVELALQGEAFDWLEQEGEDFYSIKDGETASWEDA